MSLLRSCSFLVRLAILNGTHRRIMTIAMRRRDCRTDTAHSILRTTRKNNLHGGKCIGDKNRKE